MSQVPKCWCCNYPKLWCRSHEGGGEFTMERTRMQMRQQVLLDHLKPQPGRFAPATVVRCCRFNWYNSWNPNPNIAMGAARALGDPTVTVDEVIPPVTPAGTLAPAEERTLELFERNTYSVVNIFDVTLRPQVNITGSVENKSTKKPSQLRPKGVSNIILKKTCSMGPEAVDKRNKTVIRNFGDAFAVIAIYLGHFGISS